MKDRDIRLPDHEKQSAVFRPIIDVQRRDIVGVIGGESAYVNGHGGFVRQQTLGLEITNINDPFEQINGRKSEPVLSSGDINVDLKHAMVAIDTDSVTFVQPAKYNGVDFTYSWVAVTKEGIEYNTKKGSRSPESIAEPISQAAQLARARLL